jgi:hypothetical protein
MIDLARGEDAALVGLAVPREAVGLCKLVRLWILQMRFRAQEALRGSV